MKIRGLSYQNGIFYIGKNHVACGYHENDQLKCWLKPLDPRTLLIMAKQILLSMPVWFKCVTTIFISFIFIPKLLHLFNGNEWTGLPFYTLFYYMFGTHFIFPKELRKYHGAEHKVFSEHGVIRRGGLLRIQKAAITNRYCSTNTVVIYFMGVIIGTLLCGLFIGFGESALAIASYGSLLVIPLVSWVMNQKGCSWLKKGVLAISYWLQIHITTTEPERKHLLASIDSYRKLAEKEFPERLIVHRPKPKKEEKNMAIVDVTIIPIGTETASVSKYVAEIQEVLRTYDGKVTYQLTPMSTLIEGELPVLFEVIQAIHEVPFKHGIKRVATNIRIDDRRDKEATMAGKLESVREKMEKGQEF
ncbi:MTH1187 family thiamine-binding protein [bacterium LRH843]|nr:MTH1187 family thiamine-binding protein [bacterium LRH843]